MARLVRYHPALSPAERAAVLPALEGPLEVLKSGAHRLVARVAPEGFAHRWILKRYAVQGWRRALRALFGGSSAGREYAAASRLHALGLPVARPIALVEERRGPFVRRASLLLEDFGEAVPLLDRLDGTSRASRTLETAARAIAALHAAGFVHGELHTRNLLVLADGSVRFVDLARTRARRPSVPARAEDLAFLLHAIRFEPARAPLRALRAYARASGGATPLRALVEASASATRRRCGRRARGAARNSLRPSTASGRRRLVVAGARGIVYPERTEGTLEVLGAPPGTFSGRSERLPRAGPGILDFALPRGRARAFWEGLHRLIEHGVRTATPVAFLEPDGPPGGKAALFVSLPREFAPLEEALATSAPRARARVLSALGRAARRVHDAGFRLGAFDPRGIFVARDAGGAPFPALVALPGGLEEARPLHAEDRRLDLDLAATRLQLPLSRADVLRVRRGYDPYGTVYPVRPARRIPAPSFA